MILSKAQARTSQDKEIADGGNFDIHETAVTMRLDCVPNNSCRVAVCVEPAYVVDVVVVVVVYVSHVAALYVGVADVKC